MESKLAWKNTWRNKRRTLITISAIGFAVFFAVSMRSMQQGMEEQLVESIVKNNMGYIQIHLNGFWDEKNTDNGFFTNELPLDQIRDLNDVTGIEQRLESGAIVSVGDLSKGAMLQGLENTTEAVSKLESKLSTGALPLPQSQQIVLGTTLAKNLKVSVGDTLVLIGQGFQGATAAGLFVLSGTVDFHIPELNRVTAYVSLSDLQEFISAPDLLTTIAIDLKQPSRLESTLATIQNIVGENFEVMSWETMSPDLKQTLEASAAKGWIMNFILYMIIAFVMFGTILMATQERRFELGVLTAIGMKKAKIMRMVVFENILISIIGVIVGIIGAAPIAAYFHYNPIVLGGEQAEMMLELGFEPIIPFSIDPMIGLNHGLIVLCIAIALLLYPIFIIRRLQPIDAMKR